MNTIYYIYSVTLQNYYCYMRVSGSLCHYTSALKGSNPAGFSFLLGSLLPCWELEDRNPGCVEALEPNPWGWLTWPGPLCSAGWWSAMNSPPMTRTTAQTRKWHLSPASPPLQVLLPATPAVPAQVLSPVSPRVSEAQFAGMFRSQKRHKAQGSSLASSQRAFSSIFPEWIDQFKF